jgi:hypothetical protein
LKHTPAGANNNESRSKNSGCRLNHRPAIISDELTGARIVQMCLTVLVPEVVFDGIVVSRRE